MQIGEVLQQRTLPALEMEVLLAHLFQRDRTWILAHPEMTMTAQQETAWRILVERRCRHEPIAYITGVKEFYGRSFHVGPGALVPRPATEGLVDAALAWLADGREGTTTTDTGIAAWVRTLRRHKATRTVVDVGTGSGCIAITIALQEPRCRVIATDVQERALAWARQNAAELHVSLDCRLGTLLEPIAELRDPFLLVSNPPYVPEGRDLPADITAFEPRDAIVAGPDGLAVLRPLLVAAMEHPFCMGIALECEAAQVPILNALCEETSSHS